MQTKLSIPDKRWWYIVALLNLPNEISSGRVMILCHGFRSRKESNSCIWYENICDSLDIASIRWDVYGHGESEYDIADLTVDKVYEDAMTIYTYLIDQWYTHIWIMGNSMWGMVSLYMWTILWKKLACVVAVCPVSDREKTYRDRLWVEWLEQWKNTWLHRYKNFRSDAYVDIKYSFFESMIGTWLYETAHQITAPTLIIHGDQDESVPYKDSIKISELIPDCRLEIMKWAEHYFSEEDREKRSVLVEEFLKERF